MGIIHAGFYTNNPGACQSISFYLSHAVFSVKSFIYLFEITLVYLLYMYIINSWTRQFRQVNKQEKIMQFKIFTTRSGEKRIYVNGASSYGIKVFVRDGAVSGNYPANYPEIVIYSDNKLSQSEVDAISNRIDEFVQAAVPSDKAPTFANYETLAK